MESDTPQLLTDDGVAFELFRQRLKEKGLRLTPQRMAIFQEISLRKEHFSIDELFCHLREQFPGISLDTVYRTVQTLLDCGVVTSLILSDGKKRFDANLHPHHHFLCKHCHKIVDFEWASSNTMVPPEVFSSMGTIDSIQMELHGVCSSCNRMNLNPSKNRNGENQ